MSVSRSVAEVLADHVTLEVEGIDRMYLNVYVPGLQPEEGVACLFRFHRGKWLRLLPHPYEVRDRKAGYRYEISILQAEFSLPRCWIAL